MDERKWSNSLVYRLHNEIIFIEFPKWASINTKCPLPSDSVWIKAVDLNDNVQKGASDVVLASLMIRRDNPGNISLRTTVIQRDDDDGDMINVNDNNNNYHK